MFGTGYFGAGHFGPGFWGTVGAVIAAIKASNNPMMVTLGRMMKR